MKRHSFPFLIFRSLLLLLAGSFLALNGCGVHKPFELVDGRKQIKPGSLAVVSGGNAQADMNVASYLTAELKEKSTFRVMSQADISRRVPGYPSDIIKASSAPKEAEGNYAWLSKADKGRIDAVHEKLDTNYVFVVWVGDLSRVTTYNQYGGGSTSYVASVYGRLLEYPKANVVAYSIFGESKGRSCCLFGNSEGDDIDTLLKNAAETVAKKFIDVSGAARSR